MWPYLSEEMKRYDQCEIFKEDCSLEAQSIEGAVIVNMTGEEIILSENELKLLKRGPKYCMLKTCSEEALCCQVEVCLTKHKWDCMANPEDYDLRSRVDGVNNTTKDWSPEPVLKGKLDDHPGMVESQDPPKLCERDPGECDLVERDGGNQNLFEGAGEALSYPEGAGEVEGVFSLEGAGEDLVCEGGGHPK